MRLPEATSARERLISLKATELGFVGLTSEQLGPDAKHLDGFRHRMFLSSNGLEWEERQSPLTEPVDSSIYFKQVAYGASQFVVVGGSVLKGGGEIWRSGADGVWHPADMKPETPLSGVEWTNWGFMAFGTAGAVLRSSSGLAWTVHREKAAELRALACSSTVCVFGGTTNFVVLDTRSGQWSVVVADCGGSPCERDPDGNPLQPPVLSVIYGHSAFNAETQETSAGKFAFSSMDGVTWHQQDLAIAPQAFVREVAVRSTEPDEIAIWNLGGASHRVTVTNENPRGLDCTSFECIALTFEFVPSLLLIPDAPKVGGCD